MKFKKKFCLIMETSSAKGALGLYSFKRDTSDIRPIKIHTWEGDHSACLNPAFESLFPAPHSSGDPHLKKPATVKKKALGTPSFLTQKDLTEHTFLSLGVGPGRWTGTRVGVSFARSLNFISQVPLYPVSSLKILAESQFESSRRPILVLMNAFKKSLYMALYQKKESRLKEIISPCVVLPEDLAGRIETECVCVGDGWPVSEKLMPLSLKRKVTVREEYVVPEIRFLARLLQREFDPSGLMDWRKLAPVYLRSPVPVLRKM